MSRPPLVIERINDHMENRQIFRITLSVGEFRAREDFVWADLDQFRSAEEEKGELERALSRFIGDVFCRYIAPKMAHSCLRPTPAVQAGEMTATQAEMMGEWGESVITQLCSLSAYRHVVHEHVMDALLYGHNNPGRLIGEGIPEEPQPDREEKAMDLLRSRIGDEKFKHLKKHGYFEEKGQNPDYTFRFHKDKDGGVTLIERKKYGNTLRELVFDLCVQSTVPDMPEGDVILARWMEWKHDENKFLDTANFRKVKTRDEASAGRLENTDPILARMRSSVMRFMRYESIT